jgi:drug/metabolite transporter (DMT)-like permease
MEYSVVIIVWLILLVLAYPYVHRARHPATKPMAAYLLFVSLFSAVGGGIFLVLFWFILATGAATHLGDPLWSVLFVAIVILPAFFTARWQLKRPPWGQSVPK